MLGIPIGVLSAIRRNAFSCRAAMLLAIVGVSLPSSSSAVLLYVFWFKFGIMPSSGRVIGAQAVIDAVGLADRMRGSDLVVTGEGCFDWQSLRGKVVTGVARTAMELGTPAVVIAGQVLVGRRESVAIGIEATYPVARDLAEVPAALADPAGTPPHAPNVWPGRGPAADEGLSLYGGPGHSADRQGTAREWHDQPRR